MWICLGLPWGPWLNRASESPSHSPSCSLSVSEGRRRRGGPARSREVALSLACLSSAISGQIKALMQSQPHRGVLSGPEEIPVMWVCVCRHEVLYQPHTPSTTPLMSKLCLSYLFRHSQSLNTHLFFLLIRTQCCEDGKTVSFKCHLWRRLNRLCFLLASDSVIC